jgi:hypothetical protein
MRKRVTGWLLAALCVALAALAGCVPLPPTVNLPSATWTAMTLLTATAQPSPTTVPSPTASTLPTKAAQATLTSAPTATATVTPATATAARPTHTTLPPTVAPQPSATFPACLPTDQDQYVYGPDRLQEIAPCRVAVGVVDLVQPDADGDIHFLLKLDPPYHGLLTAANANWLDDLVVEPVCAHPTNEEDAVATCAADPDPMTGPFPTAGQHIWMEGRYVLDLGHGGWAELHPLYRWGVMAP